MFTAVRLIGCRGNAGTVWKWGFFSTPILVCRSVAEQATLINPNWQFSVIETTEGVHYPFTEIPSDCA